MEQRTTEDCRLWRSLGVLTLCENTRAEAVMPSPKIAIIGSADPARQMAAMIGAELARRGCCLLVYDSDNTFIEGAAVSGFVKAAQPAPGSIVVRQPQTREPKLFAPEAEVTVEAGVEDAAREQATPHLATPFGVSGITSERSSTDSTRWGKVSRADRSGRRVRQVAQEAANAHDGNRANGRVDSCDRDRV